MEIRAGRSICIDDLLRQQVGYGLAWCLGSVGSKDMVEAEIFADDDDDVLDRRSCLDFIDSLAGRVAGIAERVCFVRGLCRQRAHPDYGFEGGLVHRGLWRQRYANVSRSAISAVDRRP